jgi:molybdopterin-binding protein
VQRAVAAHSRRVGNVIALELADGTEIVSIITNKSVQELKLQAGMTAYAVIKASNVMIAID